MARAVRFWWLVATKSSSPRPISSPPPPPRHWLLSGVATHATDDGFMAAALLVAPACAGREVAGAGAGAVVAGESEKLRGCPWPSAANGWSALAYGTWGAEGKAA